MSAILKPADLEPVSRSELETVKARARDGCAPAEREQDILERYNKIPNRMIFLYSSEDSALSDYVRENWAALDALSGNLCDVYPSMLQLSEGEDIYSFRKDLYPIPGLETVRIDKLPIILIWSDTTFVSISLRDFSSDVDAIRKIVRGIFQSLYEIGGAIKFKDQAVFKKMLGAQYGAKQGNGTSWNVKIDRRVIVTKNIKADRGSVVLTDHAKARDISVNQKRVKTSADLATLAEQLATLRVAMKTDADKTDPTHDIAIGQVAAAENAAKAGDKRGALAALKQVGSWGLHVAEKIGVELAAAVIKDAIGMPKA